MDSPRARPPGSMNWHRVLWHEFVHVVTLQKTHNRIPRWLSEGISVYEEVRGDSSWGQRLDPDFKAVADESIPTVEELEAYFIQPPSQEHLLFGYFAAGEFVRFYADAYGDAALVRSLEDIGAGRNALEALSAVGGQPLAIVNLRFRRHLEERLAPLAHLPDSTDAADDAPFSRALLQGDRAAQAGNLDAAESAYLEAHDLYPDYVSDDAPLRLLARLYKENDLPQRYLETLQRIVSRDPTAYEEGLEAATLLAAHQRWGEAASVLQRTAQIVPFHIPLLTNRADYLIAAGDLDAAVLQLRKVLYLDPARGPRHRLQLARTLAQQGATPAAKSEVIALLEEMPSFWDAQQLLLEIVEGSDQP